MNKLSRDALKRDRPTDTYVTKSRADVASIAGAIYGDSTRGTELLKLNAFEDALDVPAGTVVVYYADVGAGRAAAA